MIVEYKVPVSSSDEFHDALRYLHKLGHAWKSGASLIGGKNWYEKAAGLCVWSDGMVSLYRSGDFYETKSFPELRVEELAAMCGCGSAFDENMFLSLLD